MTTATLASNIPFEQNAAGPAVPSPGTVNAGGMITRAMFTLSVTPATGWAEAAVRWGPDGINWPGQMSLRCDPNAGGSTTHAQHFHDGAALAHGSIGNDGAQYFSAEIVGVDSPTGVASASLTMTY